jgi:hypothetical protein
MIVTSLILSGAHVENRRELGVAWCEIAIDD